MKVIRFQGWKRQILATIMQVSKPMGQVDEKDKFPAKKNKGSG